MLTMNALTSAIPLTTILDERKIFAEPIIDTPLSAVTVACRSDPALAIQQATDIANNGYTFNLENIQYMANAVDPFLKVSKHDLTLQEVADTVSTKLAQHIAYAKNVVREAIRDLVESTTADMKNAGPSQLLGYEVIQSSDPEPLFTSALSTLLSKHQDTIFNPPPLRMRLPDLTFNEIVEIMLGNGGILDKAIENWIAIKGEGFFTRLWENIFQVKDKSLATIQQASFQQYIQNGTDGVDTALAIFMLSRKLLDNPLPKTELSLRAYSDLMGSYRDQSALRLVLAIKELDNIDKNGILVRNYTERTVTVDSRVYAKWIDNGGENEMLFGNLLQTPVSITVKQMDDNADKYKRLWNHHISLASVAEKNRRFVRVKTSLLMNFERQLREPSDGVDTTGLMRHTVMNLFKQELDRVREDELKNLWGVCLRLVCRSRFSRTDAEVILSGIERNCELNPQITAQEAADLSIVEYVAGWVASQVKFTMK